MPRITNIEDYFPSAPVDAIELRRGYQSVWRGRVKDTDGKYETLVDGSVYVTAERYFADVVGSGESITITNLAPDPAALYDSTPTVNIADQTQIPGGFELIIEDHLIKARPTIDGTRLTLIVLWIQFEKIINLPYSKVGADLISRVIDPVIMIYRDGVFAQQLL